MIRTEIRIILVLGFILFSTASFAQEISRISISGTVKDTVSEPIQSVTVMLLHRADSTLVNFTTTNRNGEFKLNNIRNDDYLLKLSHVSLMPREIRISPSDSPDVELGELIMYPISEILMEVVVKAAQAPISFRGDTVEYDARMFRVPPGSSVEDLLKRLPGVEVDQSGNISAQGENIGRVFVDGRVFFSDDPKVVTRNLDAQSVSRVQIYNNQSEQERLTGLKDGSQERVMNLELKDEYKSGYFGKASAGGGTDERWTGSGSFNKFDEKQQLSFVLYGNNVNQTSLNWDDYSEFMGMSASNFDNGDFGFAADRHRYYSMNSGTHFDGRGFTENYGGGVNYNYFTKKSSFNASYFYHQTDLNYQEFANRHTFLSDTSFYKTDTIISSQFRNNHRISARGEVEIDSSNTIIARVNYNISNNNQNTDQSELFRTQDFTPLNLNSTDKTNENESGRLNSLIIYNHKFKKPRRSFSASASFDMVEDVDYETIENLNKFLLATDITEQINLLNYNDQNNTHLKSSLLYVEPISDRINFNAFFNFSRQSGYNHKESKSDDIIVDSLSINYEFNTLFNRLGSSLSYNHDGINIFVGGAIQRIDLIGRYWMFGANKNDLSRYYLNFVPNLSGNVQFSTQTSLNFNYRYAISEPSINQLHPAPNLANPLYRIEGNLDLDPSRYHNISSYFRYWNQSSLASFTISTHINFYDSRIIYNQNTEYIDGVGYRTVSKPENVDGGMHAYTGSWINFPIIKTVLTMNLSPNFSISNSPIYINQTENITNSQSYNLAGGFNLTLGPKLSFNIRANYGINNTSYSIQTSLNREIINTSASAGVDWQLLGKTYLQANFRYNRYNNDGFDNNTEISLLNVSIRQLLGENNRFEIRLAALDLLDQQQYIQQYATQNYIVYSESPTLSRYFMLTLSYNLKGFESNMRKKY
jgi:hypothetical protein